MEYTPEHYASLSLIVEGVEAMTRQIGGFSVEGRYFIVLVPDGWKETDPLPAPSPDDLWFDRASDFKAALNGPWIRKPVWRSAWKETAASDGSATNDNSGSTGAPVQQGAWPTA